LASRFGVNGALSCFLRGSRVCQSDLGPFDPEVARDSIPRGRHGSVLARSSITIAARPVRATSRNLFDRSSSLPPTSIVSRAALQINTWGWIILIVGVIQVFAAFSIWAGGQFGRWIGIIAASVSAIGVLLSIPGYPFWSLAVFGIDLLIIYGLSAYGGRRARTT
jgi:hypothetical protein